MTGIWIVGVDPATKQFEAIKAVRKFYQAIGREMSLIQAASIVGRFQQDGHLFLGARSDQFALDAEEFKILTDAGFEVSRDFEPPVEPTPEQVFVAESDPEELSIEAFNTALVLMALCEGNPLLAAARAKILGHATNDPTTYNDATHALIGAFPYLEEMLEKQGMMPDGD